MARFNLLQNIPALTSCTDKAFFFVGMIPGLEFKCSLDSFSKKLSRLEDSIRIMVSLMMMMGSSEMFQYYNFCVTLLCILYNI